MYRYILSCLYLLYSCFSFSQPTKKVDGGKKVFSTDYFRYTDFHIHPTYKHYFRYQSADEMKRIYSTARYYKVNDSIGFSPELLKEFKDTNWIKVLRKPEYLKAGMISDLLNYDQSGYPEIKFVPGSILCNSYSPYEKQFAFSGLNRWFSRKVVTKMGKKRLKEYSLEGHSPFRDFLAEYYYNAMQEETREVHNYFPGKMYDGNSGDTTTFCFINTIRMVACIDELKEILKHNDEVFKRLNTPEINDRSCDEKPLIITPLLMSVEGGQVLYDSLTASGDNIFNPGYLSKPVSKKDKKKNFAPPDVIRSELMRNIDSLRNLKHRLFFVTLGHFAQNHVVGFAKTLDRDPESWMHRAISTVTSISFIKKSILKKDYEGFNLGCRENDETCTPDSIGFRVMEAFLNPQTGKCGKPTYIDVKHMDIKGRLQYYAMRRKYEQQFKVKIPIIASHFAISGEGQTLAAATGLGANPDNYSEIINPERFYNRIVKNESKQKKIIASLETADKNELQQRQSNFNKAMIGQMKFDHDSLITILPSKPFSEIRIDKNKTGWYYPWSINLFDEEIIEINKSDGIIGLLMDPRQLGAFMPKYKKIEIHMKAQFDSTVANIPADTLEKYGFNSGEINRIEYFKVEPLIRNLFYIIQTVFKQREAERYYYATGDNVSLTRLRFPDYVPDELLTRKDPWSMVAIGGDFDGLIDPVDIAPTASYIPHLHTRMVLYAYIFSQMRKKEFWDNDMNQPFIISLHESQVKMKKFFYENGKNFILQYF